MTLVRTPNETRCLTEWLVDGFRKTVRDADVVEITKQPACGYAGFEEFVQSMKMNGIKPEQTFFQVHGLKGGELWYLVMGFRMENGDIDITLLTESNNSESAKQEFLSVFDERFTGKQK